MSQALFDKAEAMIAEINAYPVTTSDELEQFRIAFLGTKNKIKPIFQEIRNVEKERKKEFGQKLNEVKQTAEVKFEQLKKGLKSSSKKATDVPDLTLPVAKQVGSRHPISIVLNEVIDIFSRLGFVVSEGPEIEDDWHNFTALNFPPHHPARDMQDTFFISEDISLRTHTSSVQVRVMESQKPPIRTISPGRVYRNETISARKWKACT